MQRKPGSERALSDSVSIALILLLVVAAAAIVFIVVFGYVNLTPKSAYIAMRGVAANTSVGAATLTIFHFEGDAVTLNSSLKGDGVAPVSFNLIIPGGASEPVAVSPFITDNTWRSGNTLSIYEDAAGYWVTNDINGRISQTGQLGPLVSMPGGNYTINVVDQNAKVLIGAVPVTIAGIGATGPQYSPGLIATYYSDEAWSVPAATNIASRVRYADAAGTAGGWASDVSNWPVGYIGKADGFSVRFAGLIKTETEADYTFYLSSDDGSALVIDGTTVVNNGGLHSPQMRQGTVHLTAGYHPVTVTMFEHTGLAVVHLEQSTPSAARQFSTQLYHIPSTPPGAGFTGVPSAGPVPLSVQFTDMSSDATSYSWDFGDGSGISHVKNPLHLYTIPGKYNVTLVATNSFGSSTARKDYYITAGSFSPGLGASYYRGQSWTDLAGTRTDTEIRFADTASGLGTDEPGWPQSIVGRQDNFSVTWDGYVQVPAADTYTFYLNSDDGSWLWVDEAMVIDNGGDHSPREYTGTMSLTPGYHHLVVRMYENGGLAVAWLRFTNTTVTTPQYVTNTWHA
jgi:PKD repeat protein